MSQILLVHDYSEVSLIVFKGAYFQENGYRISAVFMLGKTNVMQFLWDCVNSNPVGKMIFVLFKDSLWHIEEKKKTFSRMFPSLASFSQTGTFC